MKAKYHPQKELVTVSEVAMGLGWNMVQTAVTKRLSVLILRDVGHSRMESGSASVILSADRAIGREEWVTLVMQIILAVSKENPRQLFTLCTELCPLVWQNSNSRVCGSSLTSSGLTGLGLNLSESWN